jgi:hypothetical protein
MIAAIFLTTSLFGQEFQKTGHVLQLRPSGEDDLEEDCRNLGYGCGGDELVMHTHNFQILADLKKISKTQSVFLFDDRCMIHGKSTMLPGDWLPASIAELNENVIAATGVKIGAETYEQALFFFNGQGELLNTDYLETLAGHRGALRQLVQTSNRLIVHLWESFGKGNGMSYLYEAKIIETENGKELRLSKQAFLEWSTNKESSAWKVLTTWEEQGHLMIGHPVLGTWVFDIESLTKLFHETGNHLNESFIWSNLSSGSQKQDQKMTQLNWR